MPRIGSGDPSVLRRPRKRLMPYVPCGYDQVKDKIRRTDRIWDYAHNRWMGAKPYVGETVNGRFVIRSRFRRTATERYAFWEYDLCPYMLAGEIESLTSDGRAIIKGMPNYMFAPIKILKGERGKKAMQQLDALTKEFKRLERDLKNIYKQRAVALLG